MIRFLVIIGLIILSLNFALSQNPRIECNVSSTCSYTHVFRISDLTDAHAELRTYSNYPYIVCCRIDGISLDIQQDISGGFIGLSYPTDAHVEIGSENNYVYRLKFKPSYGFVSCNVEESCNAYDTCLVSISDNTNAHIGDCITNPYIRKICCSFSTIDLTLNLNASRIEINDGLRVWGKVTKNNLPVENANVSVKVGDRLYCEAITDSLGNYECSFSLVEGRIGVFNISSSVVIDGEKKTSYKTLSVFASFGDKPKGKNIICEDMPVTIQNIDGSIKIAKMKICVWK